MRIIFRYIWRNILEKKLRTALILFSVAMSSALLFASLSIGDTLKLMYTQMITSASGSAEIVITATKTSDTAYVNPQLAETLPEVTAFATGAFIGTGTYSPEPNKTLPVELKGYHLEELMAANPYTLLEPKTIGTFKGKVIIINQSAARKYKLHLYDDIPIKLNQTLYMFKIVGIAAPKGPFYENGRTLNTVIPRETIAALSGDRNKCNAVYVKLTEAARQDHPKAIAALKRLYGKFEVKEAYTERELKQFVSQITTPFLMMTIVVLFMSVFIIYTSFKVITLERLPVIGTFRSIGSSRKETDLVMVTEALAYGLFGGLFGTCIGFGILAGMAYILAAGDPSSIELRWSLWHIGAGIGLAIFMALTSALMPILQVSKISVKDIVLGNLDQAHKDHPLKKPFGAVLFLLGVGLPPTVPLSIVVPVCLASFLLVSLGAAILMPDFTKWMVRLLQPLFTLFFGNIGFLSARNLNDNRSILTNITLLSIGMSGIIMILTMSTSVQLEVGKAFKDFNFDLWFYASESNNTVAQSVKATRGVIDVMPTYTKSKVEVVGKPGETIQTLRGIDTSKYNAFYKTKLSDEVLKSMENGRYVVLGDVNRISLGLNVGDPIVFKTDQGNRTYVIAAYIKTLMDNGKFGFISTKYLKMDFGAKFYDDLYVKSASPDETALLLKKKFNQKDPFVETKANLEAMNNASNQQIFSILTSFSYMAMVIGIFGVLNNLLISFIQRRRHIAIFKSVGMSQRQVLGMVFLEAVVSGLIGGLGGVVLALVFLYIIPFVLPVMAAPIPIHYDPLLFLMAVVAGVFITVLATAGPGSKSSKLNIIEAIKYE